MCQASSEVDDRHEDRGQQPLAYLTTACMTGSFRKKQYHHELQIHTTPMTRYSTADVVLP